MKTLNIAPESFLAVLEQLGVTYLQQSGWYKVEIGRAKIYIQRGKVVGSVHISGFTSAFGRPLAKPPTAKVTGELCPGPDAVSTLKLFVRLIAEMKALPSTASSQPKQTASSPQKPLLIDPSLVLGEEPAEETPAVPAEELAATQPVASADAA